jgi:hypothetical protein
MSDLWTETFFGCVDVRMLKQKAYQLKDELDSITGFFSWFKKNEIKSKLIHILDEIDYQEGRMQFANRPYSFPSASVRLKQCTNDINCQCGCWGKVRKEYFKL